MKAGETTRVESRRGNVELRRATRFTPALRLCISGCVCSTKRSLLSVFVAPERDLRPHERSFGAKRARAPFRAQLRPAPSSFSTQDRLLQLFFHFLLLFILRRGWRVRIQRKQLARMRVRSLGGAYVLFRSTQKLHENLLHCAKFYIIFARM